MSKRIGNTIKLNKDFSLEKDKHQWILIHHYLGFDKKTKEVKEQSDESYHRTLDQVSEKIVEQSGKVSDSLEGVVAAYKNAVASVTETLINQIGER